MKVRNDMLREERAADALSIGSVLRGLLPSLVLNALCPFVLYQILEPHFPKGSLTPLLLTGVFPLFGVLLGLVRQHRVDIIAVLALMAIVADSLAALLAGSALLFLLGRSLDTTMLGITYVVTLFLPRPFMFYVARQLITGNDPDHVQRFNRTLEYPAALAGYRLLTLVWGVGLLGVTALHTLLALTLSASEYLFISPLLSYGAITLLILGSVRYGREMRERIRSEMQGGLREQPVRRA